MKQRGPDFMGIGVPKSGSTWFMRVLSQHPQIFVTARKEPHHFSSEVRFNSGLSDYYDLYKNAKSNHVAGEFSTKYLYFAEKVSPRIKMYFPKSKLICILRDPVQRSISHFNWLKQIGFMGKDIRLAEAIKINQGIIGHSKYSKGVKIFLKDFGKENILFLKTEDLKNKHRYIFDNVRKFLKVNEYEFDVEGVAKSETISPRIKSVEGLRKGLHEAIIKYNQDWLLKTSAAQSFSKIYRNLNSNHDKNISITSKEIELLSSYFEDDLLELSKLIAIDISGWNRLDN